MNRSRLAQDLMQQLAWERRVDVVIRYINQEMLELFLIIEAKSNILSLLTSRNSKLSVVIN